MIDNLSVAAVEVVSAAGDEAERLGHARIGTEHLLLGLLSVHPTDAADLLGAAGASLPAARHVVAQFVVAGSGRTTRDQFTARAKRALERAGRFSRGDRASEITDVHVLIGVLDVEGLACQVLRGLGVDVGRLRRAADGGEDERRSDGATQDSPPDDAPTAAVDDAPTVPIRPVCPRCEAALDTSLAETPLVVPTSGRDVSVLYCGVCGGTLGIASRS